MQNEIKRVDMVLENCEVLSVDGKYIADFNCEDITYSIRRTACNCIEEVYSCKNFSMSIHRDCALDEKANGTLSICKDAVNNPLKRILEYPDITSIYIYFANGHSKRIYLPWSEEDEYENKCQKSYMNKFGDLFIVVS